MKTPRALFSWGAACLLVTGAALYAAASLWQSWKFSDLLFPLVVLICISGMVSSVIFGGRLFVDVVLAGENDLGIIYREFKHACRWEIADPMFWKLMEFLGFLGRRWRVIFAALVLIGTLVTAVTLLTRPTFAGTAKISIEMERSDLGVRAY